MNLTEEETKKYFAMANAIRFLSVDAVENAKSGHPGMPMGIAEVVTVLFAKHLKFNPKNPDWKNRALLKIEEVNMNVLRINHLGTFRAKGPLRSSSVFSS